MSSREELIEKATKLGKKKDDLERLPTYAIEELVKDLDVNTNTDLNTTTEFHADDNNETEIEHQDNQKSDHFFNDNMTMVDMSAFTDASHPAQQKYNRFVFLKKTKDNIINAIYTNSRIMEQFKEQLEKDDKLVLSNDIIQLKKLLQSANQEISLIYSWFLESQAQRQHFYRSISNEVNDLSGTLSAHFGKKIDYLNTYLNEIMEYVEMNENQ
jgi:hypothetical protein